MARCQGARLRNVKQPSRPCTLISSGCGAAWLARLLGVQEVPGSNPGSPTKFLNDLQPGKSLNLTSGVQLESKRGPLARGLYAPSLDTSRQGGSSFRAVPPLCALSQRDCQTPDRNKVSLKCSLWTNRIYAIWCEVLFGGTLTVGYLWSRRRPEKLAMEFDFGTTKASKAFFDRHPMFFPAFDRLMGLGNRVFGRPSKPRNQLEDVGFGLGHKCREDFMEIVFLATNGYGAGAMKLFRGLFERALTLAYFVQCPDKVDRFINYGAIQEHRVLEAALKSGITAEQWDTAMAENPVEDIRSRYRQYKAGFEITNCKNCKTTRLAPSWDLDVAAMVHKVGSPFTNVYLAGYAIPNLQIHATLSAAMSDFDKTTQQNVTERANRKRDDGDFVLSLATAVFIHVMRSQNAIFGLGVEKELDQCDQDVIDVWTPYFTKRSEARNL